MRQLGIERRRLRKQAVHWYNGLILQLLQITRVSKKTVFEDRDGNVSYSKKMAEPEDHPSSFFKRRDKTKISNFKF
jgi:hypothetical protein